MKPLKLACLTHVFAVIALLAIANAALAASGPGNALHFDGVDDYVAVPHDTALNSSPFTVAAWVRTSQASGAMDLIRKPAGASSTGWYLSLSNGVVTAGYVDGAKAGTNSIADGNWHHVAFTVNSSGVRIYVDAVLQTPSGGGGGSPGNASDTGELRLGGPALLNGELDEVSIWNTTLSGDDLQLYMNRSLAGSESALVAYYRCDETNGTQLADSAPTGGSNNGTLNNGASFVPSGISPFSPGATTLAASLVASYGATLNGSAHPGGLAATAWFQWGTTTNYGNVTMPQAVGAGMTVANFAQRVTSLTTNTYHFRAVCSNSLGQASGSDATFTLTNGPTVASGPAGGGQPFASWQPVLELNYLICTNGSFPTTEDSVPPPFLGEVRLFAGNFAPAGWTFCHGQLLTVTNNYALYFTFGTAYGGDGTNFALPDFRSRAIAGQGQGPGLSDLTIGERSGIAQLTLVPSEIPIHTHTLPPPYAISGPAGSGHPRFNRQPSHRESGRHQRLVRPRHQRFWRMGLARHRLRNRRRQSQGRGSLRPADKQCGGGLPVEDHAALRSTPDSRQGHAFSITWQVLPYALLTLGEVLVSATGLEFAYSQSPPAMKGALMASWNLSVTVGNLWVLVVNAAVKNVTVTDFIASTGFGVTAFQMFFFAGFAFVAAFAFGLVAKRYQVVDY